MSAATPRTGRVGPTPACARAPRTVSWWLVIPTLAVVGTVMPLAIAARFGALGIPRNDDWAYSLSAFHLFETGELTASGWGAMNLVGQLVSSLPVVGLFGRSIEALQVQVAVTGGIGLFAVFDLARHVVSWRRAMFVAVMVGVGPLWASLSASYMTDVPAFALGMACLALGARALARTDLNVGWFIAAVVVGMIGFTIREYALLAPLAVCSTAAWTSVNWPRRHRAAAAVALGSLVAFAGIFTLWRSGVSGYAALRWKAPNGKQLDATRSAVTESAVLLGLLVAPAVLLSAPTRIVRSAWERAPRTTVLVSGATSVVLALSVISGVRSAAGPLGPGNYVFAQGILGTETVSGVRSDLLPRAAFAALAMLGSLAVAVLVLAALPPVFDGVRTARGAGRRGPVEPPLAMVTLAAIGYAAACILMRLVGQSVFDRYLLPLVPLLAVLVLSTARTRATAPSRAFALSALVVLALVGTVYAVNSAAFDGARWEVAEEVASTAGGPTHVDGGFEWTNFHAGRATWVHGVRWQPGHPCVSVHSVTRAPGGDVLASRSVWTPTGTGTWIVARQRRPC